MDTTEEKIFKIDITDLFPKFEEHLNIQGNSRIIFSGKFGIGKTYFLNEFFENKKAPRGPKTWRGDIWLFFGQLGRYNRPQVFKAHRFLKQSTV